MIESPFGNLLDIYRKQRKLKLEALANKASVSSSYISLLIRGKKGRPSDEVIEQLAKALKLTNEERSQLFQAAEQTAALWSDSSPPGPLFIMPPAGAGLFAVHGELRDQLFRDQVNEAKELIRIQDIWLEKPMSYASALREVLSAKKSNLKIQILLFDPDPDSKIDISEVRQKALGYASKDYIRNQIRTAIDEFDAVRNDWRHNCEEFEVRTFRTIPSIQQIVFDNVGYVGFFLHGKTSQSAYQLEIHTPSPLGNLFKEEFENVWDADGTKTVVPRQVKDSTQIDH